jgi:hypothetical protein
MARGQVQDGEIDTRLIPISLEPDFFFDIISLDSIDSLMWV